MEDDVHQWLSGLGLALYSEAFNENEVSRELLPHLTAADLTELGVSKLGHRKKLLLAIRELRQPLSGAQEVATSRHPLQTEAPQAERRQLTVMFVDLVQSTELSSRLDPEDLRDVLTAFQNVVAGVVTRFDGQVAKYMGDGVLCYFGWPKAHEDDAERAVRAGLDILVGLDRIKAPCPTEIAARIGVATGLVVVGDLIGDGAAQEEAVVGETPNLAARMQELAAPGSLVVGETTRRLLGAAFDVSDLGRRSLKGISGETAAYSITGFGAAQSRFEARSSGPLQAMVGRDQELAMVLDRWRQAQAGEGQLLLLSGEAGIGKSRILRTVNDTVENQDHLRIAYQCSPFHADSALYPAIQQLTFAAGIRDMDDNEARLDKLAVLLVNGNDALIGALLGLETEGRYGAFGMTPQEQRARTLRALVDEMIALSRLQPVLFVLEDAHWIDPSTLELLDLTIDRIAAERVLMLITARTGFDHDFGGHPNVTKLTLNRLTRAQVAAMIANVAGDKLMPEELVDAIVDRTDGVPLFVEELTRTVLESGTLDETESAYVFAGSIDRLSVPATLNDSLMARLDRHAAVKQVAQIASCIGRQFDHGLLARVAEMDAQELHKALDELCAAELIFRHGTDADASYSFKHALVSDTAYQSLLRSRRREIHGQIADVLAEDNVAFELLAHHLAEAGRPEEAFRVWEKAGNAAQGRVALREATQHYRAALAQLALLPDDDESDRAELRILSRLGSAYFNLEGWASTEASKVYERALELANRSEASSEQATALIGLWLFRNGRGEHARATEITQQLFSVARQRDDKDLMLQACHAAWPNFAIRGLLYEASDAIDSGLAIYDEDEHRHHAHIYMGHDPAVCAHSLAVAVEWELARPEAAGRHAQTAVSLARRIEHIPSIVHALILVGMWNAEVGDHEAALMTAEELAELSERHQLGAGVHAARTFRGWARVVMGETDAGVSELEESIAAWRSTGALLHVPQRLSLLGEAYSLAGRHAAALDAFGTALDITASTGEAQFKAPTLLKQGEALLREGRQQAADAEICLRRAREVAAGQSAITYELRATIALAHLLAEQGRREDARSCLSETIGRFPKAQDTTEFSIAVATLEELS